MGRRAIARAGRMGRKERQEGGADSPAPCTHDHYRIGSMGCERLP